MNDLVSNAGNTASASLVLVVEDSLSLREGLCAILRHQGYRVEAACNGREGLEMARALSPDLILSDLEMPEATGFDLLAGVRADADIGMTPFVMLTAVSDRSATRRAMELGADDYLTKPFTPEEVSTVARSQLERQSNWREATQALAATYSQGVMGVLPHEFRTPLNSILGFAELMVMMGKRGLSPEQTRDFGETIQRAGRVLLSHTTRFLTLLEYQSCQTAPIPPDTAPLVIEQSWLAGLIAEVQGNQPLAGEIKTRLDIVDAPTACRADLATNMVRELLSNAFKFAAAGSTVAIKGAPEGDEYRLEIDNAGPAFPIERIRDIRAFTQFNRRQQEQQGLGIGLAIVQHAARLGRARLEVRNQPDGITRLILRLPVQTA